MTSAPIGHAPVTAGTLAYEATGFAYPEGPVALRDIDLEIDAGELVLVIGGSGSGKSTLLRCANGLVPHSSGGKFSGSVRVGDRSTRAHRPRELADLVGFVHQDPEAQFVVDHVETDLAFVLENLGTDARAMRRRVEEVLDALAIAHLRNRSPATLSGGERQRCAIAGALASAPAILVLDEPTSQLDPQGADDVLAALSRLNADLGTTIVLAEHRLERAAPLADRAVLVAGGAIAATGSPGAVLADYEGAPPVTHLGRLLGWSPLPLTVRDARDRAAHARSDGWQAPAPPLNEPVATGPNVVRARGLGVTIDGHSVLQRVDLDFAQGEIVALLGRNGSGKTTLLRTLAGLLDAAGGTIERATATRVAYVPQDPNSLLFAPTVAEELTTTLRLLDRRDPDAVEIWLERLHLLDARDRHPRSLSGGERQRVAIAAVAVGGAQVLLLDEPTRGMDAMSRAALEAAIRAHAEHGGTVVLATHDVELAARSASRAIVIGDGDIVADGPARDVLSGSLFAPQVVRVLPPFLTVAEVARSIDARVGANRVELVNLTRVRPWLVYALVVVVGAAAFLWPFFLAGHALPNQAHSGDAPLWAALVGAAVVAAVALEVRQGTMTGTTVAMLGVLSAAAGLMRLLALPGGGNGIYFLVILAGVAFGPRFGLLLGLLAMAVSAVITGGIGPWLPFQMLALSWMGAGAGLLGRFTRRLAPSAEVGVLAAYGWVWAFIYGAILNLWFWPFQVDGGALSYSPHLTAGQTLHHYYSFYVASSFAWDAAGALANAILILLTGRAVLRSLRRFASRLDPIVELEPLETVSV